MESCEPTVRFPKPLYWLRLMRLIEQLCSERSIATVDPPVPPVIKGWTTTLAQEKAAIWERTVAWMKEHDLASLASDMRDDAFLEWQVDEESVAWQRAEQKDTYEIVPGESIGPHQLGMTRAEVAATSCPGMELLPKYDEDERCCKVEVIVQTQKPTYVLCGHIMNWTREEIAMEVFETLTSRIDRSYGTLEMPAIGLATCKWEHSDLMFYTMSAVPKTADEGSASKRQAVFGTHIDPKTWAWTRKD